MRTAMLLMGLATTAVGVSGTNLCGNNVVYIYNYENEQLTIRVATGYSSGTMTNYQPNLYQSAPWYDFRAEIKTVIIEEGVTNIGDYTFYGCEALTSVTIASTVTSIGSHSFYGCYALPSVSLPAGLRSIGNNAFNECRSLATVIIPSNNVIETIGTGAFDSCVALTAFTFPSGVTSICNYTFINCTSLTSFTIPKEVTDIGANAFYGCLSLANVTIEAGSKLTSLGQGSFSLCKKLSAITIPDGVTSIGANCFDCCQSLASINIPDGVTSIGANCFERCFSLSSITIPDGVTSIGAKCFENCISLSSITIPNGVTSIEEETFRRCSSLTSITIPSSVTTIGESAFSLCYALKTVYCYALDPPTLTTDRWGDFPFLPLPDGCTFYVPESKVEEYKSRWKGAKDDYSGHIIGMPVYSITVNVSPNATFGTATVSAAAGPGDCVKLKATPNAGYRLVWWDVTGGAVIANPSAEQTTLTMPNTDITLTAIFQGTNDNPNTHRLTLDNNDGDPNGAVQVINGITEYTLPTRNRGTNYIFTGWATSPTEIPAWKAGSVVKLGGDLTLYAIWMPSPVSLSNNATNTATIQQLSTLGTVAVELSWRQLYKDGYWNTICLPFNIDNFSATVLYQTNTAKVMELDTENEYTDNGIGRLTGFDGATGTLYLYFKEATSIKAGKPYIIKWGTPITDPNASVDIIPSPIFYGVTVSATAPTSIISKDGLVEFRGTFTPTYLYSDAHDCLYLGAHNALYWPNDMTFSLGAFRAYFVVGSADAYAGSTQEQGSSPSPIRAFVLNFGDEGKATGILEVESGKVKAESYAEGWYDLQGRKLSGKPTQKGLYINNGRKVVVK